VRRLVLHCFLALALVLAQLGIQAHALSHVGDGVHGHDGPVKQSDHDPASCLAFGAAAGGAVASSALPLGTEAPHAVPALGSADPLLPSIALSRFASRAPPVRS
jgi:hypothetical protein